VSAKTLIVYYCATCGAEQGPAEAKLLGRVYRCKQDSAPLAEHLARVVKIPQGPFWLRVERRIRSWQLEYSPANWFGQWFADRVGIYIGFRFAVAVAVVFAMSSTSSWCSRTLLVLLVCFVLCDVLVTHTAIAFVSRLPASATRSVAFTLCGAATVATSFAALYVLWSPSFDGVGEGLGPIQAIYFSVVTLATVGLGDIKPKPGAVGPQLVVVAEVFVGLFFLAVLVAVVASWANALPGAQDLLEAPDPGLMGGASLEPRELPNRPLQPPNRANATGGIEES
jgi:hypothetical protein